MTFQPEACCIIVKKNNIYSHTFHNLDVTFWKLYDLSLLEQTTYSLSQWFIISISRCVMGCHLTTCTWMIFQHLLSGAALFWKKREKRHSRTPVYINIYIYRDLFQIIIIINNRHWDSSYISIIYLSYVVNTKSITKMRWRFIVSTGKI